VQAVVAEGLPLLPLQPAGFKLKNSCMLEVFCQYLKTLYGTMMDAFTCHGDVKKYFHLKI